MTAGTLAPTRGFVRNPTVSVVGVLIAVMASLFAGVANASAATASSRVSAAEQVASIKVATVRHDLSLIKDGPDLTAKQVIAMAHQIGDASVAMVKKQAEIAAQTAAGVVTPNVSVGLGWYVYMRFSPTDQRFILTAGAVVVAGIVCVVSAGVACAIAGIAAGLITAWIAYYYNWACWVEFQFTYSGQLHAFNRYWRC